MGVPERLPERTPEEQAELERLMVEIAAEASNPDPAPSGSVVLEGMDLSTDENLWGWTFAPGGSLTRKRMIPPDYTGDRDIDGGME